MKKFILSFVLLFFCSAIYAQLDRSIMPKGGPTPKIKLDKPKEFKLKNGIKVLFVENNKLPRVNYLVRFDRKPICGMMGELLGPARNVSERIPILDSIQL